MPPPNRNKESLNMKKTIITTLATLVFGVAFIGYTGPEKNPTATEALWIRPPVPVGPRDNQEVATADESDLSNDFATGSTIALDYAFEPAVIMVTWHGSYLSGGFFSVNGWGDIYITVTGADAITAYGNMVTMSFGGAIDQSTAVTAQETDVIQIIASDSSVKFTVAWATTTHTLTFTATETGSQSVQKIGLMGIAYP